MPEVKISLLSASLLHSVLSEEIDLLVRSTLGEGAESWIQTLKEVRLELFDAMFTCEKEENEQNA